MTVELVAAQAGEPGPTDAFTDTVRAWELDTGRAGRCESAEAAARDRLDALAKPVGSLGQIEALAVRLAGIAGVCPPPTPSPAHVAVFAADHGVHTEQVTPWPQMITALMAQTMAAGRASINAFGHAVGAQVVVVDVGIDAETTPAGVIDAKVRRGTRNLAAEAAMTTDEVRQALAVGASTAHGLVDSGARCLVTGEMGIANTTAATALICGLLGRDPAELTGPGAGSDPDTVERKVGVVARALTRHRQDDGPIDLLASLGGLEIVAMAGFIAAAAQRGVPVVVDGVIADAALLAADRIMPGARAGAIAGHRSSEPAATAVLEALELAPVLDLSMRLGEGTGAVLAVPILQAAASLFTDVATISELTGGS